MTFEQLYDMLSKTSFAVYYSSFEGEPDTIPYIIYYEAGRRQILADDEIYKEFKIIHVTLYTREKDAAAERRLEKRLRGSGIIYSFKDYGAIPEEELYQVEYEFEIQED